MPREDSDPKRWLEAVSARRDGSLRLLSELVRLESPSDEPAAVNRLVTAVAQVGEQTGARIQRRQVPGFGDLLELHWAPSQQRNSGGTEASRGGQQLLLLGHLDTVWPPGTLREMPFRVHGNHAYGPGIFDMKAGVVMALTALEVVTAADELSSPVTLLLNSDEEVGSPRSRPVTEELAGASRAVFVLEPAQGAAGAYKTARKGVGEYRLEITGIPAHSGVDFTAGASAVLELAHQIQQISALSEIEGGTTLNPGVIGGGTRTNVVAGSAWASIDARVSSEEAAQRLEQQLHALRSRDPRCTLQLTGGMNRPPMERRPATVRLFRQAQRLAGELGFALEEASTGGGSDGNFTSALGVPTLDGMGAVGAGAHARDECILIDAFVTRTALLAAMIQETCRWSVDDGGEGANADLC